MFSPIVILMLMQMIAVYFAVELLPFMQWDYLKEQLKVLLFFTLKNKITYQEKQ